MLTLSEQFARSPEFVDWSNPVNWGHSLNRGLVSWFLAVPNRMGWGSFTWRDLCRRYNTTLSGLTPSAAWGRALRFDGDPQHVLSWGSVSPLLNTNPRPCSVIVRFAAATNSITRHSFYSNTDSNSTNFYTDILRVSGSTYQPRLYSNDYVTGSSFTLDVGRVMTYGFTWNSDNAVAFYVNGAAAGTASKTNSGTTTAGATFGALQHSSFDAGFLADGWLHSLSLFSRVLSPSEMLQWHVALASDGGNTLNRIPLPRYAPQADVAPTARPYIIGGGIGSLVCGRAE